MTPSPCLSQWELLEEFFLVQSESRDIGDHWACGRGSSGDEGGADRTPSQDMLSRPSKAALCHLCSPKCLWDPGSAVWGPRFSKVTPSCIQPKYPLHNIMEEYNFLFSFGVIVKDCFRCNSSGKTTSVNFHIWARLALL